MTNKKTTHVSEVKKKTVKELGELIKQKRTMLIVSIKNIPTSQFQEITKKLRGKAIVKVPKKNLIIRALDSSEDKEIKEIEKEINENVAILFSDMDCFELAAELVKNKNPAKAKAGQEAPRDIEIPAGPTELVPGPAISELGAVGLQVIVEKGKLSIKDSKVIVREGEKISSAVADVLSKLDIKPFTISLIPLAGYDSHEKKIYLDIKIDKEGTLEELKKAFGKALPFAVEIGYTNSDTIKFILLKAQMSAKALEKFENVNEETPKENEEKKEENTPEVNSEGENN
jgi:large subunit ribosomal protein L10